MYVLYHCMYRNRVYSCAYNIEICLFTRCGGMYVSMNNIIAEITHKYNWVVLFGGPDGWDHLFFFLVICFMALPSSSGAKSGAEDADLDLDLERRPRVVACEACGLACPMGCGFCGTCGCRLGAGCGLPSLPATVALAEAVSCGTSGLASRARIGKPPRR